jgi:hypothetical protein
MNGTTLGNLTIDNNGATLTLTIEKSKLEAGQTNSITITGSDTIDSVVTGNITVTRSDDNKVLILHSLKSWDTASHSYDLSGDFIKRSGTHTVTFETTDGRGNTASTTGTYTVQIPASMASRYEAATGETFDTTQVTNLLTQYWWIIALIVLYFVYKGKKKGRR